MPEVPSYGYLLRFVKRHTFMSDKQRERFVRKWNAGKIDPWPFLPDAVYADWQEKKKAWMEFLGQSFGSVLSEPIYVRLSEPSFVRQLLTFTPL